MFIISWFQGSEAYISRELGWFLLGAPGASLDCLFRLPGAPHPMDCGPSSALPASSSAWSPGSLSNLCGPIRPLTLTLPPPSHPPGALRGHEVPPGSPENFPTSRSLTKAHLRGSFRCVRGHPGSRAWTSWGRDCADHPVSGPAICGQQWILVGGSKASAPSVDWPSGGQPVGGSWGEGWCLGNVPSPPECPGPTTSSDGKGSHLPLH